MPRTEGTIDGRLGRIEEAVLNLKEDRAQSRSDRADLMAEIKDVKASLAGVAQTMLSTATAVTNISLEKCGERLDKIEGTVFSADFQSSTTRLQRLETTVNRWEKWIGTGWAFIGRLIIAVIAASVAGGTIFGYASKIAAHL